MTWRTDVARLGDPYLEWAQATAFRGHAAALLPGRRVPVLMQLKAGQTVGDIEATGWVDVPGAHRASNSFVSGWAERDRLVDLSLMVQRLEMSLPIDAGVVDPLPTPPAEKAKRPLVAVIDRGCAFLNTAFRKAATGPGRLATRLLAVWEQGARPSHGAWHRPAGFGYGREIRRDAINDLIARAESGEAEVALYSELGAAVLQGGRLPQVSHGSFVMDVAAGLPAAGSSTANAKPQQADEAAQADLLFVSVPVPGRGDTTGGGGAVYIFDAVHYILRHAAGYGGPVVINLSIGAQAGAHDGTDLLAQALDQVLKDHPDLCITVAAGNGRKERWNASGNLPTTRDGFGALAWRTLPSDTTDSFLELWFDPPAKGGLPAIEVQPPRGETSPRIAIGQAAEMRSADGQLVARLAYPEANAFSTGRRLALLALAPSKSPVAASPSGRWTLRVFPQGAEPVTMDAWVQRDEPPGDGQANPVQSHLEQAHPPDTLALDGGSTLSDLASAARVLVVGACHRTDGEASEYSARNPTGRGRAPDLLVPADVSASAYGLHATGPASGSVARMSGTSVAAPIAARLWLNWAAGRAGKKSPPLSVAEFLGDPGLKGPPAPRPHRGDPAIPRRDHLQGATTAPAAPSASATAAPTHPGTRPVPGP